MTRCEKIFGRCQNGEPGIEARKKWSRFQKKCRREERKLKEEIYTSVASKIKFEERDEEQGQVEGQAQEESPVQIPRQQNREEAHPQDELKIYFKKGRRSRRLTRR